MYEVSYKRLSIQIGIADVIIGVCDTWLNGHDYVLKQSVVFIESSCSIL